MLDPLVGPKVKPLALNASAGPYHHQVKYMVPTSKSVQPANECIDFSGLCHTMNENDVERFAGLCQALQDAEPPLANAVLDPSSGEFLEHRQLRKDPRYKTVWDTSYANELGRLCQGIGEGTKPGAKRVAGTNTFFLIDYDDIPAHKKKQICHTKVVCEVRPEKDDPDRTRITIGGSIILYPGDVGTNTASLELIKLLFNSILSRKGARFSTIDLKNFYLDTPMKDSKYARIKISNIPAKFIDKYDLHGRDRNGWIYFKIFRGCYGLPQSGILANNLLRKCLEAEGYYKVPTIPGLWRHKWRPIQFFLLVVNFGVEYVGLENFNHLLNLLKKVPRSKVQHVRGQICWDEHQMGLR